MASATTDCPRCGMKDSLTFSEWTENQSPLGSGAYWPMQMQDVEQACECELTDDEVDAAANKACETVAAEYEAYAEEMAKAFGSEE
jgi:hypothetical protein